LLNWKTEKTGPSLLQPSPTMIILAQEDCNHYFNQALRAEAATSQGPSKGLSPPDLPLAWMQKSRSFQKKHKISHSGQNAPNGKNKES